MSMWDERYGKDGFFYGTEPNDFLRDHVGRLPAGGAVLCLAEGEGRNAVYLAGLGFRVTGVDGSPVGVEKMQRLARERGVEVIGVVADLAHYAVAPGAWDAVVSIWVPLPAAVRAPLHRACMAGLRPGGVMLLEAYHPRQLGYKTGGPPTADLMVIQSDLERDFKGMDIILARELDREVHEGAAHHGRSAVVQFIGRKPA